jgi:signal transduction histidine kinase
MFTFFQHRLRRLRFFTRSIRFRLALWFVVILGVVITVFSVFVYLRQQQNLRSEAADRLEVKAQRLGGFLRFASRDNFQRFPERFSAIPDNAEPLLQTGDVLAITSADGTMLQFQGPLNSDSANQLVAQALQRGSPDLIFDDTSFLGRLPGDASHMEYAFIFAPIPVGGQPVGYFLLGGLVDPGNQLPRLLVSLVIGVLGTLGVALVGGVWLADRAMRPVKHITNAARAIEESDLSLRLHLDRKDELGELADTFDEMLTRLEAAFERQRQFTADASHELRTPLTIVDLETARALALPRTQEEYERALKVIRSENQFMVRLVTNLLTLARMDAGQVVLQKEELDLGDVVLEVVERLAPIATKDQVRLSTGDLPEIAVSGDRQYLEQMLINLVENAIKYTSGDERRVQVQTGCQESGNGSHAWVRVIDNGPGIPAEHLSRLFDRFYQIDKARTRQVNEEETQADATYSGTGLGLSIAQWIARAHGGDIHAHSEPGKGSTFEVILPIAAHGPNHGDSM